MEQAQQSATLINCEADKASQTNSRHLVTSKIISTIGKSMLTLKKLLRFSGIAFPRPIPIDRPEPDDVQDFPSIHPAMHEKITSYADLQKLIHHALRMQHPDWIGVNGYLQSASFVTGENLRVDGGVHARTRITARALSRDRVCANLVWFSRSHHRLWELTSRRLRLDRCSL
jgi:hypothetical protein